MKITLSLDENSEKVQAFLNFIKTLDFVSLERNDDIPQWQKDKLDIYLDEHHNGTADYWDDAKKDLFAKYKVK
jgi:hypothetical protein